MTRIEKAAAKWAAGLEGNLGFKAGAAWAIAEAAKMADESQSRFEKEVRSMRPSTLMDVAQTAANISGQLAAAIRRIAEEP